MFRINLRSVQDAEIMNTIAEENNKNSIFQVPEEGTAYAVITVKISNREKFMEYVHGHIPSVVKYGGKFKFEGIQVEDVEHSAFGDGKRECIINCVSKTSAV